ncbi:MAG: antitoxin VbhA family protein [Gammaproteobacteria bacterium]
MSLAHKIAPANQPKPLSEKMQQILASLRLESFSITEESMEDIQLFDDGKITKQEFLARALKRAKS